MKVAVTLIATVVLAAAAHAAGTISSRDQFVKLLGKYAPDATVADVPDLKAKVPCRCSASGSAGIVAYAGSTQIVFVCWVPTFLADGSIQTASTCAPFEVIAK